MELNENETQKNNLNRRGTVDGFGVLHGKRMSYPEWGVGHAGDNPFFTQRMHDWFVNNESNIAYAAYFNVDGLWPTQIDIGRFPLSQKLFRTLFKR